ncbi:MAG: cadherin-like domain-containing protein [Dechloromonas sp.]|nr:cadherin-like domain-containing protein [Dechloromonas sp.]
MREPTIRRLRLSAITIAFLTTGLAGPATAELARVGPVVPAHGYPEWYQDSTGLALDLCLPDAIDLEQGNCLLLPGDVASAPESFPTNFADEHFWFAAGSLMTTGNAGRANLVLAVEAAFALAVKPGDQISFGRIRVKITDLPSNGTYKVIHPYGELEFPDQVAGGTIFYTDDVGVACAQGDFSCALKSGVGPFLRAAEIPGGPAKAPVVINGKTMLTDPVTPTFVTGGPFSNKFRVEGPNIGGPGINVIETELFDLMGRVHTAPIPSPLRAERAGYTRNGSGAWIDIFARAAPGLGQAPAALAISGAGVVPKLMSPGGNGLFWGQTNVTSGAVPSQVKVTNNGDVPPTIIDVAVTDDVMITEAFYDPRAMRLTVKARSSDDGPTPPQLFLPAYNGKSCDNVLGAVIDNLAVPPKEVTVRSSAGGAATVPVVTLQAAPITLVLPDLTASGNEDELMPITLAPATGGFVAGTFRIITQPAHGVVTVDANGNANYMPATNYEGADSFVYVVATTDGTDSNPATVALTVNAVNDPPVANADSGGTTQSQPLTINLLANDIDIDLTTGINPSMVAIVTPPAMGSIALNNGVATYTPDASPAGLGTFTFTYHVTDYAGAVSNDTTVTVNVQGTENLAVGAAEYRADKARWKVSGTTSIDVDQLVTVRPRNSATGAVGAVIGTAIVGAAGAWTVDVVGSSVSPSGYNQVIATSPLGGSGTATVRIR